MLSVVLKEVCAFLQASYLILHQHGDVHKHVMELLDAALQPHNVLVPTLNLTEGLLGNLGVDDLQQAPYRQAVSHPSNSLPCTALTLHIHSLPSIAATAAYMSCTH